VEFDVATESGCEEFDVASEIGLVVELGVRPGAGLAVGFTDTVEVSRADDVGLHNFLTGLGSFGFFDFDLPNLKSLLKNPGSLTFCYTSSELGTTVTTREIFTGGGWIGWLFNNDEGSRVCPGGKPGTLVLGVEAKTVDDGFGPSFGGSKFHLLRAGSLLDAPRILPCLSLMRPSMSAQSASALTPTGQLTRT
jgi:hypothetical protein